MDTDKISQDILYEPAIALPVGTMRLEYESVDDLPVPNPPNNTPTTFTERDTLFFSITDSFESREYIKSMFFRFDNINRFPATVGVKLFLIDDLGNSVYLTPDDGFIMDPAELNVFGQVIDYHQGIEDIPLTDEQIDLLLTTDRIVIELTVSDLVLTPEIRENFQFYYIQSAIGVEANLRIEE